MARLFLSPMINQLNSTTSPNLEHISRAPETTRKKGTHPTPSLRTINVSTQIGSISAFGSGHQCVMCNERRERWHHIVCFSPVGCQQLYLKEQKNVNMKGHSQKEEEKMTNRNSPFNLGPQATCSINLSAKEIPKSADFPCHSPMVSSQI